MSKRWSNLKESDGCGKHRLPAAWQTDMHERLLRKTSSLAHNLAGSSYPCPWLQHFGKDVAVGAANQMGLLEQFLFVDYICEEVEVHTVQDRLGAIVEGDLSDAFTLRVVSLGGPTCSEKLVHPDAVHEVPG